MKVAVFGCGYVGLTSGVCLAARGHHVTAVDIDPGVIAALEAGKPRIHEPGLLSSSVRLELRGALDQPPTSTLPSKAPRSPCWPSGRRAAMAP